MITYKTDVLEALKTAGYTTYKLRKEKIMGEATLQQLREGRLVSWANMDTICSLLSCQPGDLLIYNQDDAAPNGSGLKEAIQAHAESRGESMQEFVLRAIRETIHRDLHPYILDGHTPEMVWNEIEDEKSAE